MERMLEAEPGEALLRGFFLAAFPLVPGGVAMAWASSKTITPSNSRPSQSMIC
jgi:hypothetical protein